MTHRERLENAIALKKPDRLPYSVWFHFPNRDRIPRRLAELSDYFQRVLDLDFIKCMPYGLFMTTDWGLELQVFEGVHRPPIAAHFPIKNPEDWGKLATVKGTDGEYAVVLEMQRLLLAMKNKDVPIVQTIFSPLSVAEKMSGMSTVTDHLRNHPEKLHKGLERILETSLQFVSAAIENGAEGFFYSTRMSSYDILSVQENEEFVKKYDRILLEAMRGRTWLNIYHLHGAGVMFEESLDLPIQIFNWHDRDEGPSWEEARKTAPDKCFCGGLSHKKTFVTGSLSDIKREVENAWSSNGGIGQIFSPGCVLDPQTPLERLERLRDFVNATRQ